MHDFPSRIQLSRAKGWRLPAGAVSVARPTRWGNPWKAEVVDGVGWCCTDTTSGVSTEAPDAMGAHTMAVSNFRAWVQSQPDLIAAAQRDLRGKGLGCWCHPRMPCHSDVWLDVANA